MRFLIDAQLPQREVPSGHPSDLHKNVAKALGIKGRRLDVRGKLRSTGDIREEKATRRRVEQQGWG